VGQIARERSEALRLQHEVASRKNALLRKRATIERQIASLRAEEETEEEEFRRFDAQAQERERARTLERSEIGLARHADTNGLASSGGESRRGRTR